MKIITKTLKEICKVDWGNTSLTKKSYVNNGQFLGVSAAGADGRMSHFEHEVGVTVISAIGANCGRVFFPGKKFTAIKNTITLTPDIETIYPKYLFFSLRNNKIPKRGAGQPFVSKGDVERYQISFPDLSEQKHIVGILEVAESSRTKRQEAVCLISEFIKSAFSEMFGDPIINPKRWPIGKLKDFTSVITKGTTPTTYGFDFIDRGIKFLKIENISEAGNIKIDSLQYISSEANEFMIRSQLKEGDIVFSIAGALGRTAIITKEILPANINQALSLIRLDSKKIEIVYLSYLLRSGFIFRQIERCKRGVAQLNLNLQQVGDLDILIPSLELQQKFADLVQKVEKIKEKQQESKKELNNLFNSLMQKVFKDSNADN